MSTEHVRAPAGPAISVVIASWCNEEQLVRCLESLSSQCDDAEVIVATSLPAPVLERVRARFPFVRGDSVPGATVFRLRAIGAARAAGKVVAIIEDHVTVGPQWVNAIVLAHRNGHDIIGGPVENGLPQRAFDWALYFVEYGVHMPPIAEGEVRGVSGVNVAYDRALLLGEREVWQDTLQENEVNDRLVKRGIVPWMAPSAWVAAHLPMTLSEAMRHLYDGGRHFGCYRSGTSEPWKRVLWVMASPAVPFVLLARITRCVGARAPERLWALLRGIGYVALILGAWSAGEMTGYVSGARGDARPGAATDPRT